VHPSKLTCLSSKKQQKEENKTEKYEGKVLINLSDSILSLGFFFCLSKSSFSKVQVKIDYLNFSNTKSS
jgi:hypothetical protein